MILPDVLDHSDNMYWPLQITQGSVSSWKGLVPRTQKQSALTDRVVWLYFACLTIGVLTLLELVFFR